jgi:hypothetical protein
MPTFRARANFKKGDSNMEARKKMINAGRGAAVTPDAENGGAVSHAYAPRKLTFAENALLTIKVLAALGLIGFALWGISLWTSAK